ncbi:NIPSNAP family protein [Sabulicella rubraurantiaca]|uniref:NIPSNAP family protein n=1 Tax=Sabulicella rubraurantiaca TaxID=2811429 RepID=UPI001A96E9D4|nr:NIPSNAP family protein [Sabulicella rubraurantiaca]
MIVDLRIYTCLPQKLPAFVKLYEEKAWPLQLKYLENCLGWYTTIEGELNTVVHLWGYKDQADREARRNAMAADPEWGVYLKGVAEGGMLIRMENRIMKPAAHFEALRKGG